MAKLAWGSLSPTKWTAWRDGRVVARLQRVGPRGGPWEGWLIDDNGAETRVGEWPVLDGAKKGIESRVG